MSLQFGLTPGQHSENEQEFELNLAPIIDCFTVLITFMLASASFLSLGILDAGIAAAGAAPAATEKAPPIAITVELSRNQIFTVKVTGKATSTTSVAATKPGEWNFDGLVVNLSALRSKWPDVSAVTMVAEDAVEYKDVVKAMEVTRKSLPVVLLGGF